ncbi:MAG TPA: UDP-N-acetylmuramoyl-L-alanyl-D-glutamate--2,6-diaminopimelate ligase [Pseudonocardiaceae bacterium]|nr:UDP-N-acetylmuramoyl-L-alanyl-D-glutamate--2,6-diaminopimelate ligase [Pseudonocardiaceae bacterium]
MTLTAPVTSSLIETPLRPSHTAPIPVPALAALAGATVLGAAPRTRDQTLVTGIALRAQRVLPGDLFAALPSLTPGHPHGADFAGTALAAGAVAVLTDPAGARRPALAGATVPVLVHPDPRSVLGTLSARIFGDPSTRLAVLGITGTSGKTTTAYLLEAGLRAVGVTTGLLGTVETRIGDAPLPSACTTPEAPDLQALLALMVERGVTHVPIEVSSHALALGRVAGTTFAVGAFTNLSQDHLDFHADLEDYFAAKATLFDGRAGAEVVCIDDAWGQRLVTSATTTVSLTGRATWYAADLVAQRSGSQAFRVLGPDGFDQRATVRLPGTFNVTNALIALAVAHAAGADPQLVLPGIATAEVPGRMQRIDAGQGFLAVVDYAHKPAAVAALLDAVRAQITGRLLVVLGCGGDRDTGKRPLMGAEAARRADLLVVTDDNPRSEDPAVIRAAMLVGARDGSADVVEIADRAEAIGYAVARAGPGDAVVVAGKGHETGQQVGGSTHPFSDTEVLAGALADRSDR